MKNIITTVILIFSISLTFAQNDTKAKKLLDDVSNKMSEYENIYVEFKYNLDNVKENVHQETRGDVTLKGDLYNVNFLGTNQFFDGKKTYTIISEDEEVNISDADDSEEGTITPSKFFSFYKKGFNYKWDILQNLSGRKIQYVKLIPIDSNSDINNILLGIDINTNHIYKLIETGNNGTVTTLTVSDFKTNQPISKTLFVFNRSKYENEGYIINEL
ncbi:outer membrane lipoprotein carrier protein LolA [Aureibaculum marinum]|uniref:Outer membrane lipoprotein carrier protein LolA n=1 Tax=Aureibaculum marinum TaxID=2487930 RepID=A0A3N4NAQ7_9FLAO|nr:outer membrane lipoprotein carrier protein LolA [Aureibaculum marinum]RPD93241.1 outer membrane lipoprotein carrier protein LolA [Aureibaculum marinum]